MKKKLLALLSILILSSTINLAYSKTASNSEISTAIRLYKAGNYTECYSRLNALTARDRSNALAYYYLGMTSSHLGKKEEAIANYEKAISLTSPSSALNVYASKGKRCLEYPDKCQEPTFESSLDEFITKMHQAPTSDKVKGDYEKLKIENMMREINRSEDIDPNRFKEFKDFSSMNDVPTNDEIVAALRVLQKAGFGGSFNNFDLSLLNGFNAQPQMLGSNRLTPEVIQAMLTNNMSLGF